MLTDTGAELGDIMLIGGKVGLDSPTSSSSSISAPFLILFADVRMLTAGRNIEFPACASSLDRDTVARGVGGGKPRRRSPVCAMIPLGGGELIKAATFALELLAGMRNAFRNG